MMPLKPHGRAQITEEKLEMLAGMINDGMSHREIRRTVPVGLHTLRKYFPGSGWSQEQSNELSSINLAMRRQERLHQESRRGV